MNRSWVGLLMIASIGCGPGSAARAGTVTLTSQASSHSLNAGFVEASVEDVVAGRLPTCTVPASAGDCYTLVCPTQAPMFFGAGTITASVEGTQLLSADANPLGIYAAQGSGPAFTAGQTVSFAATGAAVPAFTGSVSAPEPPATTLPASIPSSADLVVTWTASIAAEDVSLLIIGTGGQLICRAPASQGTITVASSLLSSLGTGTAAVSLAASNSTRQTAGEYTIDLSASARTSATATIE